MRVNELKRDDPSSIFYFFDPIVVLIEGWIGNDVAIFDREAILDNNGNKVPDLFTTRHIQKNKEEIKRHEDELCDIENHELTTTHIDEKLGEMLYQKHFQNTPGIYTGAPELNSTGVLSLAAFVAKKHRLALVEEAFLSPWRKKPNRNAITQH